MWSAARRAVKTRVHSSWTQMFWRALSGASRFQKPKPKVQEVPNALMRPAKSNSEYAASLAVSKDQVPLRHGSDIVSVLVVKCWWSFWQIAAKKWRLLVWISTLYDFSLATTATIVNENYGQRIPKICQVGLFCSCTSATWSCVWIEEDKPYGWSADHSASGWGAP